MYPSHLSATLSLEETALKESENGSTLEPKHKSWLSSEGVRTSCHHLPLSSAQAATWQNKPTLLHSTTTSLLQDPTLCKLKHSHSQMKVQSTLVPSQLLPPRQGNCCAVEATSRSEQQNRLLFLHVWGKGKT